MDHFFGAKHSGIPVPALHGSVVATDELFSLCTAAGEKADSGSEDFLKVAIFGNLQNARALRRDLGADTTASNDAIIRAAYVLWGPECASRFQGQFAIALYDERAQQLYLWRDRLGTVPLYVSEARADDGAIFFATSIQDLLPFVPTFAPRSAAVAAHLKGDTVSSFFDTISQVPAASYICIDAGRVIAARSYSDASPTVDAKSSIGVREQNSEKRARTLRLLDENIQSLVLEKGLTGILMDDDIVSAGLTGLVSIYQQTNLRSVTCTDNALKRKAAHRFGTVHTAVKPLDPLLHRWTRLIWYSAYPITDAAAIALVDMAHYLGSDATQAVVSSGAKVWSANSVEDIVTSFSAARQTSAAYGITLFAPLLDPALIRAAQSSEQDAKKSNVLQSTIMSLLGENWLDGGIASQADLVEAPSQLDLEAVATEVLADGRFAQRGLVSDTASYDQASGKILCAALEIWLRLFVDNDELAHAHLDVKTNG